MNTLEIIHLRSSAESIEPLCDRIRASIKVEGKSAEVITLYRRIGLETDVAIHIRHLEKTGGEQPSDLGRRLASELKAFGMVEHAVWEETQ
jgi:hypothetical protein